MASVNAGSPQMCDRLSRMGLMRVDKGQITYVAPPQEATEILRKLSPSAIWFDASARI